MFFYTNERTGRENGYQSCFLVPRGDGSIDVKERHIRPLKVPEIKAFRASGHQRQRDDLTAKYPLWEHINKPVCRVELVVWITAG